MWIWYIFVRRQDYVTKEWKRSQLEIKVEDYDKRHTYASVWKIFRKEYPNRIHSSQVTVERDYV